MSELITPTMKALLVTTSSRIKAKDACERSEAITALRIACLIFQDQALPFIDGTIEPGPSQKDAIRDKTIMLYAVVAGLLSSEGHKTELNVVKADRGEKV